MFGNMVYCLFLRYVTLSQCFQASDVTIDKLLEQLNFRSTQFNVCTNTTTRTKTLAESFLLSNKSHYPEGEKHLKLFPIQTELAGYIELEQSKLEHANKDQLGWIHKNRTRSMKPNLKPLQK